MAKGESRFQELPEKAFKRRERREKLLTAKDAKKGVHHREA